MAPKEPFKVYSLSKHIENTNKGLSAEDQYNRRPLGRPSQHPVKMASAAVNKSPFGDVDYSDEQSSDSESSDDESGADFLRKLTQPASKAAVAPGRPSKDPEIADSDTERKAKASSKAKEHAKGPSVKLKSAQSHGPKVPANEAAGKIPPSSSSDATSESESESSGSGSGSKSGSDSDSGSDESESQSGTAKAPAKTKQKPAASSSSSDASDSDESDDNDEKPATKPTNSSATSTSSSASPAESDQEVADESMHIEDRQHGGQGALPTVIPHKFFLRKSSDGTDSEDVARICSQANMQGKQFWYFTVPSGVPVSVVQNLEIPMGASQRGDRAFTHDGKDFGISVDNMAPKRSIHILIPSADGTQYQAGKFPLVSSCFGEPQRWLTQPTASQGVDRVMQVRRITQPDVNGSTTAPSEKRAPRPQPKGLKARYKPIGVETPVGKSGVDSGLDGSDSEMADASGSATAPKAQPDKSPAKRKKGKRNEGTAVADQEAAAPRNAKRKQPSSEDEAAAAASQLMEESQTADSKTKESQIKEPKAKKPKTNKKPKTDRGGSPDLGSDAPASATVKAKQTPVMAPAIATAASSLGSTPAAASSSSTGKPKTSKKAKSQQSVPSSSQSLPPAKMSTPVPIPRQTAVPLPHIPSSAQQPKESPVPIPLASAGTPASKEAKKIKGGAGKAGGTGSSQQTSPPPSAQAPEKKKKSHVPAAGSKAPT